jgi:exoribonuclease R
LKVILKHQTTNTNKMSTMIHLVGVLELSSKYRYGLTSRGVPLYLFRPYDETAPEYIVGSNHRDLSVNQIAIVELTATVAAILPPAKPRANLIRLLGPVGDFIAEREGLIYHYCPPRAVGTTLSPTEIESPNTDRDASRMEISAETGWQVFHVDPAGCRDIDDAIAFHPDTGRWAITIADVAAAVPVGSQMDIRAKMLGATFYDARGSVIVPMLPPVLSEGAASLLPGQKRRGISLVWHPSTTEELVGFADIVDLTRPDPVFVSSWITVEHSFTYESFTASAFARDTLGLSCEAVRDHLPLDSHEWIASLMIRYNAAAARVLKTAGRSCGVLRIQPQAKAEKVASWAPEFQHLAAEAAVYVAVGTEEANVGHASLRIAAYTHASSPLRRYADLVNQRALFTDAATATIVDHLNKRAKANKRWSRDITFLTHVLPGRIYEVDVVFVTADRVWVPTWKQMLRLRHIPLVPVAAGTASRISVYCDPTRRNWKRRVLTA